MSVLLELINQKIVLIFLFKLQFEKKFKFYKKNKDYKNR